LQPGRLQQTETGWPSEQFEKLQREFRDAEKKARPNSQPAPELQRLRDQLRLSTERAFKLEEVIRKLESERLRR
jgi:uncharacterized protein YeeX (DUF496 family)